MKGKSSPKSSWLSVKSNRKTCVLELKNSLSSIGLMLASPLQRASKKSIRSTRLWPRWTLRQRQMQNIVVEAPLVGTVSVGVVAMVHLALASVPIADLDVVAVVAVEAVSPRPTLKLRLTLKLKQIQNIVVEATLVGMASVGVAATVPSALASVPIADLDVVAVAAAVAVLPRPMLKPKLTLKLKQMLNVAMVAAIGVIIMATTNLGATTDATLESR